jgi:hypothetical protein
MSRSTLSLALSTPRVYNLVLGEIFRCRTTPWGSSLPNKSPCPDRIAPPTHICLLHLTHEQGLHRRLALARVQVPRQYRLDEAGRREPPNADSASRTTVQYMITIPNMYAPWDVDRSRQRMHSTTTRMTYTPISSSKRASSPVPTTPSPDASGAAGRSSAR